jgi:hypothetical protein
MSGNDWQHPRNDPIRRVKIFIPLSHHSPGFRESPHPSAKPLSRLLWPPGLTAANQIQSH